MTRVRLARLARLARLQVPAVAIVIAGGGLGVSCAPPDSQANLSSDYVLTTSDPNDQNHTDVLLRYEDDWLPGTCVGQTRRFDDTRVVLEWACRYETNAGETNPTSLAGVLHDDDGDGTYDGTVIMKPVPDVNSTVVGPFRLVTFTMTPLP